MVPVSVVQTQPLGTPIADTQITLSIDPDPDMRPVSGRNHHQRLRTAPTAPTARTGLIRPPGDPEPEGRGEGRRRNHTLEPVQLQERLERPSTLEHWPAKVHVVQPQLIVTPLQITPDGHKQSDRPIRNDARERGVPVQRDREHNRVARRFEEIAKLLSVRRGQQQTREERRHNGPHETHTTVDY